MTATKLFEAGYTDLVKVAQRNKRPVMAGWQSLQVTLPMAKEWDRVSANVGLRGERFPAIDVDLGSNAVLAEAIVKHAGQKLGGAPKRFSPKAGSRLLVYRTDDPFLKMRLTLPNDMGAVEVLGAGRQYLVHGIHPDGGPYHWNRVDLCDIAPERLTVVTEKDMLAFLEFLRQEYGGRINVVKSHHADSTVAPEDLAAPSLEALTDLISRFPNSDAFLKRAFPDAGDERDTWVAFGHAVKGAGGSAALPAFLEWTKRYEDGVSDLALAEDAYHGFQPERYGWPTLDKIFRAIVQAPDEVFEVLDEPEPENTDVTHADAVPFTDEEVVDWILPSMKKRVAYVSGGWKMWDGSKWSDDESGLQSQMVIRRKLRSIALELVERAKGLGKDEGKAMLSCARRLQNKTGIDAVVSLSKAVLSRDMKMFDRDLMSLNTPAGLVDLRDGSVRLATPEDLVSRSTSVAAPEHEYDPSKAPAWEGFLKYLTRGDADYRAFLQRYMGYCLTGHMDEKKFAFVWGSNSNTGKSTFVNAVNYAFGDYARSVDVDVFMTARRNSTDNLAQLPGVRLVTATEPSAGQKWDDKLVKAITGGDVIEARRLYQSYFTFKPQFKILIAGNHEPELKNVDAALLKRVMIVPMNRTVTDPDYDLGRKLEQEAAHILRWMIDGCIDWQEQGLNPPDKVTEATEEYAEEEDTMAIFLEEYCDLDPDGFVSSSALYVQWEQWCNRRGARPGGSKSFSRDLRSREDTMGTTRVKRDRWGFKGLTLRKQEVSL